MNEPQHRLSNIDPEERVAQCLRCGPTTIRKKGKYWRCSHAGSTPGPNGSNGRGHYRHAVGDRCDRCGFIPEDECQLDVDHVDGDHDNHHEYNLQTLCANCHRLKSKQDRQKKKRERLEKIALPQPSSLAITPQTAC